MDEPFVLTVNYKNQNHNFETQLFITGYTYKFRVLINDIEVFFERDEEGSYRAIANADSKQLHLVDAALLQAIAQKIEAVLA